MSSLIPRLKLPALKLTAPRKLPDSGISWVSIDQSMLPPLVMSWTGSTRSTGASAARSTSATSSISAPGSSAAGAAFTFNARLAAARRYASGVVPSLRRTVRA